MILRILSGTIDDTLEAAIIELKSLQAAAKAFLQHGVRKVSLQTGFLRIELFLVMPENLSQELGGKSFVLVFVKDTDDAGHVDSLFVRIEAHGTSDRSFEVQSFSVGTDEPQGQAKAGNPYLKNGNRSPFEAGRTGILRRAGNPCTRG